jgi:hypothetical protein
LLRLLTGISLESYDGNVFGAGCLHQKRLRFLSAFSLLFATEHRAELSLRVGKQGPPFGSEFAPERLLCATLKLA